MSAVADRRSVGELLVETDLASRRLLHEAHHFDAAAAVRTWPELVQAAHELLDILPRPSQPTPGTEAPRPQGDLTGERLHLMATTLHRQLQSRAWPEPGPAHPDLEAMTANLVRAHDLIHRHLPAPVHPSRAVLADADAARTRTLHALYLTSHAIGLAVRARERDLATSRNPRARHVTNQRAALRHVHTRLAAFELVAGVEVYRHYPAALTGERRDRANPERLPLALAAWDIAAHRALAQDPHLPTLVHVTRTQSAVTAMSRALLEAAAAQHRVDPDTVTAQLRPQLAATEAAWGTLHSILADLNSRGPRPVRPDLGAAGSEVVAAFSELVLDGTTLAAASHVSDRTSTASLQAVTDALAAGHDLTALVADTAADPALTAHAGAVQQTLHHLAAAPDSGVDASPDAAWVDPADLATGRLVALPDPVRDTINRYTRELHNAAAGLSRASETIRTHPDHAPDGNGNTAQPASRPAPPPPLTRSPAPAAARSM